VRQVRENAQTIQNVVTYDAVIDVDNRERALMPGMTASVTFIYATRADSMRVSNAALRFKPDRATITAMGGDASNVGDDTRDGDTRALWVLRDGRTTPVTAHIGISDGTVTEVTSGDLRLGDHAISEATLNTKRTP
jgi:HlyD family secretion protein